MLSPRRRCLHYCGCRSAIRTRQRLLWLPVLLGPLLSLKATGGVDPNADTQSFSGRLYNYLLAIPLVKGLKQTSQMMVFAQDAYERLDGLRSPMSGVGVRDAFPALCRVGIPHWFFRKSPSCMRNYMLIGCVHRMTNWSVPPQHLSFCATCNDGGSPAIGRRFSGSRSKRRVPMHSIGHSGQGKAIQRINFGIAQNAIQFFQIVAIDPQLRGLPTLRPVRAEDVRQTNMK